MKSFKEYLTELKRFAKGRDVDYTVDDKFVLCFTEKDKDTYHQTGDKTHGAESHALKHLGEFDPGTMRTVMTAAMNHAKEFIKNNPDHFCGILSSKGGFVATDSDKVLTKIDPYIVGNTLDLINDKVMTKKTLLPIEKELTAYTKKIKDRYLSIIDDKMKRAIDLDKIKDEELTNAINNAKIIKFDGWQGVAQDYHLDFTDNSIIISTPDYLRTMYVFDRNASSKRDVIKNFFSKKFEVDNKKIASALKTL